MTSGSSMQAMTRSLPPHLAGLDVYGKDALQALYRCHGGERLACFLFAGIAARQDMLTMFAVGREYPVKSCEVQSRARHECGQAGDKIERVENDVGGAVSKRLDASADGV